MTPCRWSRPLDQRPHARHSLQAAADWLAPVPDWQTVPTHWCTSRRRTAQDPSETRSGQPATVASCLSACPADNNHKRRFFISEITRSSAVDETVWVGRHYNIQGHHLPLRSTFPSALFMASEDLTVTKHKPKKQHPVRDTTSYYKILVFSLLDILIIRKKCGDICIALPCQKNLGGTYHSHLPWWIHLWIVILATF